jgi:hypothetical protein
MSRPPESVPCPARRARVTTARLFSSILPKKQQPALTRSTASVSENPRLCSSLPIPSSRTGASRWRSKLPNKIKPHHRPPKPPRHLKIQLVHLPRPNHPPSPQLSHPAQTHHARDCPGHASPIFKRRNHGDTHSSITSNGHAHSAHWRPAGTAVRGSCDPHASRQARPFGAFTKRPRTSKQARSHPVRLGRRHLLPLPLGTRGGQVHPL